MSKYSIKYSNIFKKELKKVLKQGKEIDKLLYVVDNCLIQKDWTLNIEIIN